MAQRRDSPTPGGSRRPGQRGQTSRGRVAAAHSGDDTHDSLTPLPASPSGSGGAERTGAGGGRPPRRSRFTTRAFVLAAVVVALAVSYASSTRAYMDQRDSIRELRADIADTEAKIADLEREKRRWKDPSYVKAQARSDLGYLMPGETGYQVLDSNGQPLEAAADLHDPDDVGKEDPTPWWEDVWGSVELAGNPPEKKAEAPEKIDGVKKNKQQENQ